MSSLRPYDPADLDALASLWHECKRAAYHYLPLEQERALAEDRAFLAEHVLPRARVWVAEDESGLLGFLALEGSFVERLYVRVDRWRSGVGTQLLRLAQDQSTVLELYTNQQTAPPRAFYERNRYDAGD